MLFIAALFTFATFYISSLHAAPPFSGIEAKLYTDYECLPPADLHDFSGNVLAGTFKDAIPWTQVMGIQPDPSSRLIFEQRVGQEYLGGVFVSAQDDDELQEREADPLTGTRATLNLVQLAPRKGPHAVTPFIEKLAALNEDHHLYRIQPSYFKKLDSRVFRTLLGPGTLIFTHTLGGMVISPNRKQISFCVPVDSYEDTSHHHEWLVLDPADFDGRVISKIAIHFTEDPKVAEILKCEELLVR